MTLNKVEICGVNTAKLPIMTNDEKEQLILRIKDGDLKARQEFIYGNLRLVLSIIHRFNNTNENIDVSRIPSNNPPTNDNPNRIHTQFVFKPRNSHSVHVL